MWHEIWHAIKESLVVLPILIVTYLIIELIELKSAKSLKHSKFLKGKCAPLLGGAVGLVPQCGFSVIATDLYTKKAISVGTLLAVYIATSDEAVAVLLTSEFGAKNLWLILVIKLVMAVVLGYGANLFVKLFYKPKTLYSDVVKKENFVGVGVIEPYKTDVEKRYLVAEVNLEEEISEDTHVDKGCCGHAIEQEGFNFWKFIYHPLIHSLKIFGFIVAINIVFALIIHFVGEESLVNFLSGTTYFQPLFAGLIGLIPNCASSVVISKLYAFGGLSLGACITGLSVNAGIAYALLIKQNANKRHTLYIILTTFLFSLAVGTIISLF